MRGRHEYHFPLREIAVYTFSVIMCFIIVLLLFCTRWVDYSYQRLFLTGNIPLLCCGALVGAGVVLWRRKCGRSPTNCYMRGSAPSPTCATKRLTIRFANIR